MVECAVCINLQVCAISMCAIGLQDVITTLHYSSQWRIQDFSNGGANLWVWGENVLFGKDFVENCMKMKEIGLRGTIITDQTLI